MSIRRVVAITGCDSGLGWALAARSTKEGLVTIAGMYHGIDTKAAEALKKLQVHPCQLDVTKQDSVNEFRDYVRNLLKDNSGYRLYAIINNAGVMAVGDHEWQPPGMIENTINVNVLGSMRVASAFLQDLRKTAQDSPAKPRIINVASHCGLQPLPGFAPYSASKAALIAWTQALRLELYSQQLTAVTVVPGGFVTSSSLLSNQAGHAEDMLNHLDDEQKQIYEGRIRTITEYLKAATQNNNFDSMKDENIIGMCMNALLDDHPKEMYKYESWRYMFYYNLLKLPLPEAFYHWLVKKFLTLPE